MRRTEKPIENTETVFLTCLSTVRNRDLKRRLTSCKDIVVAAGQEFDLKARSITLHTITRETVFNGNVLANELVDVYTRMVTKGTPGRLIYDKLLSAAPNGICPLCSQRGASTLDHHLCKTEYPLLSVTPINLVPSCKDCNFSKTANYPATAEEETIHPYFDNIEDVIWLSAEIIQNTPATITFSVSGPEAWEELLVNRVKNHFKVLCLNELYSVNAGVELNGIRFLLTKIFNSTGSEGVRAHLLDNLESREADNINSWQSSLYRVLYASEWFCNGGFRAD